MRILLLNDRLPPEGAGGAEMVLWRLAQGFKKTGHDTHVIAASTTETFEEVRDGIPTYHISAGYPPRFQAWLSLWNPQTVGAFRDLLARIQPDVVNAHNIHFLLSYHTLKLARAAGCGVVFSAHDAMPFAYGKLPASYASETANLTAPPSHRLPLWYNLRQNRFRYNPVRNIVVRRYLERGAHFRTVPSHALARAFADNDMPDVDVVRNGIDPAEWAPVAAERADALRQRLDLIHAPVILIAGRLTREKGVRQMLLALDRVRETLPGARLLVLTARDIEAQIPAEFAHLRPFIRLGGWLTGADLRAAYQMSDVVAVPSIYLDPFPTVNLEAMALGKPVVATCFGGSPELVVDSETGFIVNPFDTATFADRLLRLLRDQGLRREMGWRGRERIRRHFTLDQQARKYLEIYERAIARSKD